MSDTDRLTDDIERTRGDLTEHVDELRDKLSPASIVDRRTAAARRRVGGLRDSVMGSAAETKDSLGASVTGTASSTVDAAGRQVRGAPLAAGLAAFGLGMVAAALVPASRAESRAATQVKDVVQEHAEPLVADVRSGAADVGHRVLDDASDAAAQVQGTGREAVDRVRDEGASSAASVRDDAQA